MSLYLAAAELLSGADWHAKAEEALRGLGFCTARLGATVVSWAEAEQKPLRDGILFADAIELRRIWLTAGRHALGAGVRRLYFAPGGTSPLREPEHKILEGRKRPPAASDSALLDSLIDRLTRLRQTAGNLVGGAVLVEEVALSSASESVRYVQGQGYLDREWDPNATFKETGFDHIPERARVVVVGCGGLGEKGAKPCADQIQKAFAARKAEKIRVELIAPRVLRDRLGVEGARSNSTHVGGCVFHLVLPGTKEEPLDPESRSLMEELDRAHLPWRRSYSRDPLQYSVPDQLGSLLRGMGGRSFQVRMPEGLEHLWSVGIDLGHGERSTLCVSLVDPKGALVCAWTTPHPRNEEIDTTSLSAMLDRAADCANEQDKSADFLVLRDGRLFEREGDGTYLDPFRGRTSLFEIRKSGNPPLFFYEKERGQLPEDPVWAKIPAAETGFLLTQPMRKNRALDRVIKISWKPAWNQLELSEAAIGDVLLRLAMAPSLGQKPSALPAPIYWADGIAGANDNDLRFRGQPALSLRS